MYRKLDAWVVRLVVTDVAHEYWFDEWTDALAWAVGMVGA